MGKNNRLRNNEVIPGNLQDHVSTNRSVIWCKTLQDHFIVNMLADSLLTLVQKKNKWHQSFKKSSYHHCECLWPSTREVQISKMCYLLNRINKRGCQSLWGFLGPGIPEITWNTDLKNEGED